MMRRSLTGFAVALVCAWAVCGPDALAGSANSPPGSGDPPKGAAFKKDAQGTKLNGVISIELTEVFGFEAKSARGILRLRRGNDLRTFFARVVDLHDCDGLPGNDCVLFESDLEIEEVEVALLIEFAPQILAQFFPDDPSVTITPKLIEESMDVTVDVGSSDSVIFVADVVLAVK